MHLTISGWRPSLGIPLELLEIEEAQKALCIRHGAAFVSTPPDDRIGFATTTAD